MRFLINNCTDAAFNLALEEILTREFPGEFLMLWRNSSAVIVGKNQNTFAEVNGEFASQNCVQVIRRMTGGGAVYHDLGNVNYSLLIAERHPGADSFARFARPVVETLQKMGVPALFSGRNDIEVEGKKVSGSAQCCVKDRTLFHGTLLFDANMEMLSKVLNPSKMKMESKGVRSVRARVGNLKALLPEMSVEQFIEELKGHLQHFAGVPEEVPAGWIAKAELLANEKYRTWEWNWGTPFESTWENKAKFPAGVVELKLKVRNGVAEEVRIQGDFFGECAPLQEALQNVQFRRQAFVEKLKNVPVEKYIKGLSKEEFLSLIDF